MAIRITIVEETAVGSASIGVDVDSPIQTKVVVVDGLYVESSIRSFDDLNDTPALKIMDAFVASNAAGTELEYVKPTLIQGQGVTVTNPNLKDSPTVSARISDGLKFETNGDLSVDESVVRTSRKVVAGNGLSQDNPDLTTDITLNVEADRGLNVTADKVGIALAANSGIKVGTTTEVDINGTAEETNPIGTDVFIMENAAGQKKRVTKDNMLAGLGKGAEIRGTINPKSTDIQPINTLIVTGDALNPNIMQGVTPNGAYPSGYLYVIILDEADKEFGVNITMMGPTGSPVSAVVHDQDQLQFIGNQFTHLATGNAVISVHGRKGVVTSENSDYTSSQIDVVPTGNLASTNTQSALEEHQSDIDVLDVNVADNKTLIQSLSETNSVGVWTSGVTIFDNLNDVAVFGGKVYVPKTTTTLPYTAQGVDPTAIPDNDFVEHLTNLATNNISEYVYKPNHLRNHNFIASATGVVVDATPRDFASGEPIRDGWIANEACTGVTYINGELSLVTGSYYQDIPRTGTSLEYISEFIASVSVANESPTETGVSWSVVGDSFHVVVTAKTVFSVCFNEGDFAASHSAYEIEKNNELTPKDVNYDLSKLTGHNILINETLNITPFNSSPLITLNDINSVVTGFSGELIVKSGEDYTQGKQPGEFSRFPIIRVTSSDVTLLGGSFDGNDEFTQSGYSPSEVNIHFEPVKFQKDVGRIYHAYCIGFKNKGSSGHSVQFGNSENSLVALGYGERSSAAAGFGGGDVNARIIGMLGVNQYDAHYVFNSTNVGAMIGNIANGGTNGTVVDIAGGNDLLVAANVGVGMPKAGLQVIKSPNSGTEYNRVHLTSNLLFNNTRTPQAKQGEIQIGKDTDLGSKQGERCSASANQINVVNSTVPGQSQENSSVFIGYGAEKTIIHANSLFGSLDADRLPATYQIEGATDTIICDNHALMDQDKVALVSYKNTAGRQKYNNNSYTRISANSEEVPTDMIERDGYWEYSINRNITTTSEINLFLLTYPGGFEYDEIEITVGQGGDKGISKRTVVVRGAAGFTTAIYENTENYSYGTAAPSVNVVANALSGTLDLKMTPNSTGVYVFNIRIKSTNDDPGRFIPKFN